MKVILNRLWREPAFLGGVLTAVVALVVSFGLDADGQTVGAISAVISVLTGVGVRTRVTPIE